MSKKYTQSREQRRMRTQQMIMSVIGILVIIAMILALFVR